MSQDKPQDKKLNRRDFLKATGGVGAAACLTLSGLPGSLAWAKQTAKFTPWGWPTPYEKVSEKSLKWLDSKGWLPLSIGFFADLPGYSGYYAVMRDMKLLEKRGIPVKYQSFLCGPPILESYIGGNTQVTGYGDFPYLDHGGKRHAFYSLRFDRRELRSFHAGTQGFTSKVHQ